MQKSDNDRHTKQTKYDLDQLFDFFSIHRTKDDLYPWYNNMKLRTLISTII
jgi:hypothetical protein